MNLPNVVVAVVAAGLLAGCGTRVQTADANAKPGAPVSTNASMKIEKITRTDEEWKKRLTPEQYEVTRKHGTERAFSGALVNNHEKGVYKCVGCGLDLFASEAKFESGTGWPSYFQPINDQHVGTTVDKKFFMTRTEVHCARCESHLGHIFDDGPKPTGLRYCINSASLTFEKK